MARLKLISESNPVLAEAEAEAEAEQAMRAFSSYRGHVLILVPLGLGYDALRSGCVGYGLVGLSCSVEAAIHHGLRPAACSRRVLVGAWPRGAEGRMERSICVPRCCEHAPGFTSGSCRQFQPAGRGRAQHPRARRPLAQLLPAPTRHCGAAGAAAACGAPLERVKQNQTSPHPRARSRSNRSI